MLRRAMEKLSIFSVESYFDGDTGQAMYDVSESLSHVKCSGYQMLIPARLVSVSFSTLPSGS
jgi:hypothetical protein